MMSRRVHLRAGKSYLEQPIQCLYPLELDGDVNPVKSNKNIDEAKLSNKAKEFGPK